MNAFLDYINHNKEWLFSGIGIVLLGLLVKPVAALFKSNPTSNIDNSVGAKAEVHREALPSPELPEPKISQELPSSKRVSDISIGDIRDAICKAPPLQKEDIRRRYIGLRVRWAGNLSHAEMLEKGSVQVVLSPPKNYYLMVSFIVPFSEYPELGVLPEGSGIVATGTIQAVRDLSVFLEDVQLEFNARS